MGALESLPLLSGHEWTLRRREAALEMHWESCRIAATAGHQMILPLYSAQRCAAEPWVPSWEQVHRGSPHSSCCYIQAAVVAAPAADDIAAVAAVR